MSCSRMSGTISNTSAKNFVRETIVSKKSVTSKVLRGTIPFPSEFGSIRNECQFRLNKTENRQRATQLCQKENQFCMSEIHFHRSETQFHTFSVSNLAKVIFFWQNSVSYWRTFFSRKRN